VRHTHEFASRFCFIDYDRELAIVAEIESEDGTKKLAGIGRLVADAARGRAEYAVLVADPWQHCGLGNLLTAYCLEVAPQWGAAWGLHQVCGETATENANMIATFEGAGFKLTRRADEGIVFAERELTKA
jgi:acetyltransferase